MDFLAPYFMVFVYYKLFSDCCGEWEGDASFVLLRLALFVNKVLTLSIYENQSAIGSGDNVQYK